MRILVTGGAGYIGSHFAKAAKQAGHLPVVLDNLSTGHQKFVKFGPFVNQDVQNTKAVETVIREHKIESVVHFAGRALVSESIQRPDLYYANNVVGTFSLLEAMRSAGVRKLVFSSSCATYGLAQTHLIEEAHPQKPLNPYGQSKLMCEKMILDFVQTFGIRAALLRYFNVIGADPQGEIWEDHDPETHVVPNLVRALTQGHEFELFGNSFDNEDGTAIRDYVDVNDIANVHLEALAQLGSREKLVSNIGSGKGHSVRDVLNIVSRVFGKVPRVIERDARLGDPARLVASADFFRSWCKVPMRTLEESVTTLRENLKRGRT